MPTSSRPESRDALGVARFGVPEQDTVSLARALQRQERLERATAAHHERSHLLDEETQMASEQVRSLLLALEDDSDEETPETKCSADPRHGGSSSNDARQRCSRLEELLLNAAKYTDRLTDLVVYQAAEVTEYSSFAAINDLSLEDRRVLQGRDAVRRRRRERDDARSALDASRTNLQRSLNYSMTLTASMRPTSRQTVSPKFVPVQHPRAWISRANSKPPAVPPSPELVRLRKKLATPAVSGIAGFGDGSAVLQPMDTPEVVSFMSSCPRRRSVPPHLRAVVAAMELQGLQSSSSFTMRRDHQEPSPHSAALPWTVDMYLLCNKRVVQALAQLLPAEAWRLASECEQRLLRAPSDSFPNGETDRQRLLAVTCHNMGLVFFKSHRFADAMEAFDRSLQAEEKIQCPPSVGTLINMSVVLVSAGRLQDAIDVARLACDCAENEEQHNATNTSGANRPDADGSPNPSLVLCLARQQLDACLQQHASLISRPTTQSDISSRRPPKVHLAKAMKHFSKLSCPLGYRPSSGPPAEHSYVSSPNVSKVATVATDDMISWVAGAPLAQSKKG